VLLPQRRGGILPTQAYSNDKGGSALQEI